ncbi:MAG: HlyD family secretion protein [Nitrospirae bacterium]|nr:HlyD family secretion protein [Nitrospirota bacterium]
MEEIKTAPPANNRKKKIAISIFLVIAIAGVIIGYIYIQYKKAHITTDDAAISGRIHVVSSKVPGTIKNIAVNDNQPVKKGEVLAEIDTADLDIRLQGAVSALESEKSKLIEFNSKLDTAKRQLDEYKASAGAVRANLELKEANMLQAEADLKRADGLLKEEIIPREMYEKTKTAYDVAMAQVKASKEDVKQAESRIETQKALIKQVYAAIDPQKSLIRQKEASLSEAELNLGYTRIIAPTDGYITRKSVETGNQVQAGQPLMAVVPLDEIWVIANYKETQLERVKPGQRVDIRIDTYPDKKFKGRIDSIMAGTGAVFSLFPPENATGNFVKVVQRIPVKIVFDKDTDRQHILRVGMSVEPTILVE